jgi:hypothetical protein
MNQFGEVVFQWIGIFQLFPGAAAVWQVKYPDIRQQIIAKTHSTTLFADEDIKPVFLNR